MRMDHAPAVAHKARSHHKECYRQVVVGTGNRSSPRLPHRPEKCARPKSATTRQPKRADPTQIQTRLVCYTRRAGTSYQRKDKTPHAYPAYPRHKK